jgi:hypothetical protein
MDPYIFYLEIKNFFVKILTNICLYIIESINARPDSKLTSKLKRLSILYDKSDYILDDNFI